MVNVMKRLLIILLTIVLLLNNNLNVLANETQTVTNIIGSESVSADVTASIASTFTVRIPKTITLNNEAGKTVYSVDIIGDLSSNEYVSVIPDNSFLLSQEGKDDITATVTQDKTKWKYNELSMQGNGEINVEDLSSGSWHGFFSFNIELKSTKVSVISATDSNGTNLNASASTIEGEEKEQLLNSLLTTGLINSIDDVDAIIDVQSDEFDSISDTVFDVSNIAKQGDKVTILHFDETKQEWEYIGTETVDENGQISGDFTSYSPVVFVKVDSNGNLNIALQAGLYDDNNVLLCAWEDSGINIEKDFADVNGDSTSPYRVISRVYKTATKVVVPDSVTKLGRQAFRACDTLKEIVLPETITEFSYLTFYGCKNLRKINIPKDLITIGDSCFSGCSSLKEITIPNNVTTIKASAFNGCSFTEITLPSGISTIPESCFAGCRSLKKINALGSLTRIEKKRFSKLYGIRYGNPRYCNIFRSWGVPIQWHQSC